MSLALVLAALLTPWGEQVTDDNCWREYPRPQMVRSNWTCLNGAWDYAITAATNTFARPTEWAGKIRVPYPIESALSGVGHLMDENEFLWYTRPIVCSAKPNYRTLLHFDGVDFRAQVFIGHNEVTEVPHAGAWEPFTLDITDYITPGTNELTVMVWDPTEGYINARGKQCTNPRGCFYTRASGIWQSVWMEEVPEIYIADYQVVADLEKRCFRFRFDVVGGVRAVEVRLAGQSRRGTKEIVVPFPKDVRYWTPEDPFLYTFTATCGQDSIEGYCAVRSFTKGRDENGHLRFLLNGKPTYIMGTLDQGWWPDGLITPPSVEAMAFDIRTLKECGFNMMRKHIKVEPRLYYALCDKLGILVVQDLPSAADYVPGVNISHGPFRLEAVRGYGWQRHELKAMITTLQKVPSIVMWCPYNEGWSQPHAFLTHATFDFIRRADSTRLIDGPSGCWDWEGGELLPNGWQGPRDQTHHLPSSECEVADVVDKHLYRGPGMLPANDRRISFLGEFGGLGHIVKDHLWAPDRANWGYEGMKDTETSEGLLVTYLKLVEALEPLVNEGLAGSVYTQTTDVETELNGLLTYDRRVLKMPAEVLKAAHAKIRALVR